MDSGNLSNNLVWGWERFFYRALCIPKYSREAEGAYSQYVLERLETTLLSLSALMEIKFVCIN